MIGDVLTGATNPSGKLTVSFPRAAGAEPIVYGHKPMARGFPRPAEFGFVFPFGPGLSYTTFGYSDLEIEADRVLILRDHVIRDMLRRLGATVTDVSEPFHPEEGAYAHSHGEPTHALLNR